MAIHTESIHNYSRVQLKMRAMDQHFILDKRE